MKRFLTISAVILSAIFLLLSLAGIAGVWLVRVSANRAVNTVFEAAGQARLGTASRIDEVMERRETLRLGLGELSSEIEKAARRAEASPVVFNTVDQLLDGRLAPALSELDQAGRKLYADLAQLDAAVTAMNRTFLFRDRTGALDELSAFLDSLLSDLEQLDRGARSLEAALRQRKTETTQALAGSLLTGVEEMDARVVGTQERLEAAQIRLDGLQAELDAGRVRLLNRITVAAVILTAFLGWLAASQFLAARYTWESYRNRRP